MSVKVTFQYDPQDPDPDDRTGMSESEFDGLIEALMALGGYDVEVQSEDA